VQKESYRRIVASLLFGVAAAVAFWATNYSGPAIQQAMVAVNPLALLAGIAVSGNVNQPSPFAFYAAIVIQWAVIFFLGLWLAQLARHWKVKGKQ
jgi:hypothetical protein